MSATVWVYPNSSVPTASWTSGANPSYIVVPCSQTSSNTVATSAVYDSVRPASLMEFLYYSGLRKLKITENDCVYLDRIDLPDGAYLEFDSVDKTYTFNSKDAKTKYRSKPTLDYNPFLETHDVLEKFVQYCRSLNLTRDEFMKLPMNLFLMWLVLESAKQDGEDIDKKEEQILIEKAKKHSDRISFQMRVANDNLETLRETANE